MQINNKKIGFRDENKKSYFSRVALAFLYVASASCFMPIALFSEFIYKSQYLNLALAVVFTLLGVGICIKLLGSYRPILPFCIISGVALFFSFPTPAIGAVVPVLFSSAALAAYLFRERFYFLSTSAPVFGAIATFLFTKSIFCAILPLLLIPLSFTLFYSFKAKKQRVESICSISFVLGAPLAVLSVVYICLNDGGFSLEVIKNFFDTLREGLIEGLSNAFMEATNQAGASEIISIADATAAMTEAVNTAFNLMPAFFICSLFVAAFFMHALYISLIAPTVEDIKEITNSVTFRMSLASAILFLLSFFAALILEKDQPQYSVVAQNIYTVFFPGLTMVTFTEFNALKKGPNSSCLGTLLYTLLFAMLIFATDIALTLGSITGAVLIILSEILKHKKDSGSGDVQ